MPEPAPKASIFTLDRTTLVPIGLLITVVTSSIWATTWIQRTLLTVDHKIERLSDQVGRMERVLETRWTIEDMATWAELLQAKNKDMVVPVPKREH